MLNTVKNAMYTIGDSTGDFAKRFGSGTADLAKRIGPKRAIIGALLVGSVVAGSILLVHYLRARKEDLPVEGAEDQTASRAQKRTGKRGGHAQYTH